MSNTSTMKLTSAGKLEEFIEKMKGRRERQKQALQVCMNNYEISVGEEREREVVAKNSYTERGSVAAGSRGKSRRFVMPRIEGTAGGDREKDKEK